MMGAILTHVRLHEAKAVGVPVVLLLLPACQQEMAGQPSYKPLRPSDFFPDGRSARPIPAGTIARGAEPVRMTTAAAHCHLRATGSWTKPRRPRALLEGQTSDAGEIRTAMPG